MRKLSILIIGGTGFIGTMLTKALHDAGYNVSVLSRKSSLDASLEGGIPLIKADASIPGKWQEIIPDFDIIINLAGVSIFRRWTSAGKRKITGSRINTTRNIAEAIRMNKGSVRQLFSISGVGYYGYHGDEIVDENFPAGSDFLARLAAQWEMEAEKVRESGVRPVILRLGHVLGTHGGVFPKLLTLAKLHLASRWGSGKQWISWIHIDDVTRTFLFLLDNRSISGPINITAPNPVCNHEMMGILTGILGKRVLIPPIPRFTLRLMLGQFSTVFVNGQRVIPHILKQNGFIFKYPNLDQALIDLLKYKLT